jgi:hypothetical protein
MNYIGVPIIKSNLPENQAGELHLFRTIPKLK